MSLDRLDVAALYRAHWERTRRREKTAADWDGRAAAMSRGIFSGAYVDGFVSRMDLSGCRTLLDVGCGPGTIALTVAPRLEHVYGLDYSAAMLAELERNAAERGIANASTILRAWEDDWADVPSCDVVVASRSTQVADLEAALRRLRSRARRRVYLTHLAGGRFLDDDLLRALGRDDEPLPDYLYAVALLHRQGVHPRVDYIDAESRLRGVRDFDDCRRKVEWALGELSPEEAERLRSYYDANAPRLGRRPMRWAFVSWEVDA